MTDMQTSDSFNKHSTRSFFSFLTDNYEISKFILPKKKPIDDSLDNDEMKKLLVLMEEKDFYEINSIIKSRYKTA